MSSSKDGSDADREATAASLGVSRRHLYTGMLMCAPSFSTATSHLDRQI